MFESFNYVLNNRTSLFHMKVLTTEATIFIPLNFIAGVYGMNFEYMPELGYRKGYFAIRMIMGIIFLGMLYYFKKKKRL